MREGGRRGEERRGERGEGRGERREGKNGVWEGEKGLISRL